MDLDEPVRAMGDRRHRRAARERHVRAARCARGGRRLESARADGGPRPVDPARGERPRTSRWRPESPSREEAVETLGALWRQRLRWAEGSLRRLLEHGPGAARSAAAAQPQGGLPRVRRRVPRAAAVRGDRRRQPRHDPACRAPRTGPFPPRCSVSYGLGIFLLALGGLLGHRRARPRASSAARRAARCSSRTGCSSCRSCSLRIAFGPERYRLRADATLHRSRTDDARRGPISSSRGRVVLAAEPDRLETAEAIGIAGGPRRVRRHASRRSPRRPRRGARVVDAGAARGHPGTARLPHPPRRAGAHPERVALDDAADGAEVAARLAAAARAGDEGAWLTGRGWSERSWRPSMPVPSTPRSGSGSPS